MIRSAAAPGELPSVVVAAREALAGRRRGLRAALPFAGPAFIASVAYMDPGNFATNVQAGALNGYDLLWVVVVANVVAMAFQALSARLGIVTGRNLAELCRERFPAPVVWGMWIGSEAAAMATDLAEFLGGAIGFALLLHLPLLVGMGVTAVASCALLMLQRRGFRTVEVVIAALVGVVCGCYLVELAIAPPDWAAVGIHSVLPQLDGPSSLMLAVGIVGATVMPHAIYLHSALTQNRIVPRDDRECARLVRLSDREVVVALGIAGLVNMAMLAMAARVFHPGHPGIAEIGDAYRTLIPLLGGGAAAVYLASLFASGLSSSAVGTMAGQTIMQGFVGFRIPLWVRRVVTMAPPFAVVAYGVYATEALVLSQVVLSLQLPFAMGPLIAIAGDRRVMGPARRGPVSLGAAWLLFAVITGANLWLVVLLAQAAGLIGSGT